MLVREVIESAGITLAPFTAEDDPDWKARVQAGAAEYVHGPIRAIRVQNLKVLEDPPECSCNSSKKAKLRDLR